MRLLCFGDVHLGAGSDYGSAAYGPGSRLDDQRLVLERIAHVAQDESVEAVLFAGDAFHRRRPSPSEIVVWRQFLQQIDLDVVAIDGNHDVISADLPSALETVWPSSEYEVIRRPTIHGLGRGVHVATLPWTPPARLIAHQGVGQRDDINATVADLLVQTAAELRKEIEFRTRARKGGYPPTTILMLHWSISGATTPNGVSTDFFREPVIPAGALEELGYDYIVAGHIHKPQDIAGGPAFYVGSPCVIDFGEAESEHGVTVIDTDTGEGKFIPIEDRPFVILDTDPFAISDALASPEYDLEDIAGLTSLDGAVVRVRYTATPEEARRIDHAAIRSALLDAGASRVYAIQPTIIREERRHVEGVDETMDAAAAMAAWLESQDVDPERADELRQRAVSYLEEVAP
jgi:exonuclease SbcD